VLHHFVKHPRRLHLRGDGGDVDEAVKRAILEFLYFYLASLILVLHRPKLLAVHQLTV
jgi:hypothetical protein